MLAKSADTTLAISATGMTALSIYDSFELYSYNTDAQDFPFPSFDPEDGTNSPLEGGDGAGGMVAAVGRVLVARQSAAGGPGRGRRPVAHASGR